MKTNTTLSSFFSSVRAFGSYLRQRLTVELLLVFACVALGIFFRVHRFGEIPFGLNQDEASTGYDAYALFKYGVDRNGFHNPVVLVSWGSGMYALASYVTIPFLALFGGLSVTTLRLPHLVIGLLTLVVFALFLKKSFGTKAALIGLALLALNPWHAMISRWALDSNLLPAFFLLGVTLLLYGREKKWCFYSAFVAFGLCLYAYGTAYVAVPVFLALYGAYALFHREQSVKSLSIGAAIFAAIALPVALFVLINTLHLSTITTSLLSIPRLTGVPRFSTMASGPALSTEFMMVLASRFQSFVNLLLTEHDGFSYNALPNYGALFTWMLPLVAAGFVWAVQRSFDKGFQPAVLLVFWLIASCSVALALNDININRLNIVFLPCVACAAVGVSLLAKHKALLAGTFAVLLVSFTSFSQAYFSDEGPGFSRSLHTAAQVASEERNGPLCVTENANMPYIYVLFGAQPPPDQFYNTVNYENPGAEFQGVRSFDRYTFGLQNCDHAAMQGFVVHSSELSQFQNGGYVIQTYGEYAVVLPYEGVAQR